MGKFSIVLGWVLTFCCNFAMILIPVVEISREDELWLCRKIKTK